MGVFVILCAISDGFVLQFKIKESTSFQKLRKGLCGARCGGNNVFTMVVGSTQTAITSEYMSVFEAIDNRLLPFTDIPLANDVIFVNLGHTPPCQISPEAIEDNLRLVIVHQMVKDMFKRIKKDHSPLEDYFEITTKKRKWGGGNNVTYAYKANRLITFHSAKKAQEYLDSIL